MSPYNKDIFHHHHNIMIILWEFNIKIVLLYNRPYSHFLGISITSFHAFRLLVMFLQASLIWSGPSLFLSFMMTCSEKSGELFCRISLSLYLSDLFLMTGFPLNNLGKNFYMGDDLFFSPLHQKAYEYYFLQILVTLSLST